MNLDSIRVCVADLKIIRSQLHDRLDASIRDEFDASIERLEHSLTNQDEVQDLKVSIIGTLNFLAKLIEVSTDLRDFISSVWK